MIHVRRSIIACQILWFLGCGPTSPSSTVSSPAILRTDRANIDLGNLRESQSAEAHFRLENVGGATLELKELRLSCTCAGARVTKSRLEPGESTELRVQPRTDRSGEHQTVITIVSNSDLGAFTEVSVRWKTGGALEIQPARVNLGIVRPNQELHTDFRLFLPGGPLPSGESFSIRAVRSSSPAISTKLTSTDFRESTTLRVDWSSGSEPGPHGRSIQLDYTGIAKGTLQAFVDWTVGEPVVAVPSRLSLGLGKGGTPFEARFEVLTVDSGLRVDSIAAESGTWISNLELEIESPSRAAVKLQGVLPSTAGSHRDIVLVKYSLPEPGVLEVPVSVIVRGPTSGSGP